MREAYRNRQRAPYPAREGAAGQRGPNQEELRQQTPRVRRHPQHGTHGVFGIVAALALCRGAPAPDMAILGVQRQTTADTLEGDTRFSHRSGKDQDVRWTMQRGDGRAGKGAMSSGEARVFLRHHRTRSRPCSS